jgi:ligand-binding sensor domain-containing protein
VRSRATLTNVLLACAILPARDARALSPDKSVTQYVKDGWSTTAGLPQNTVSALAQTKDGYLWVGTEEGLARFDGVRFVTFDRGTTPAMPSGNVQALLGLQDGRLWIGTYGAGLVLFDGLRFIAFGEREGLVGHSVLAMAEDGEGGLWVGTERGLNHLRDGRFLRAPADPAVAIGAVKTLLRDSQGALWVGSDRGLTRLLPTPARSYSVTDGLPRANIIALHEDRDGALWVGTDRGLARRQGDRFVTYTTGEGLVDNFITSLTSDAGGALWIGANGGLQRFLHGSFESLGARDGLPTDHMASLLGDREGSLWVGTRGGGLVRLKEGDFVSYGRREGLASDIVDSIYGARDGSLWLGGYGGNLMRLSPAGKVEVLPTRAALSGSSIRALYEEDDGGDLWLGTWTGLYLLRNGHITNRAAEGLTNVRVITRDRAGRLWVGTDSSGLFCFEGSAVRHYTTRDGLPGDQVRAIHEDRKGQLWIGTYGGLASFANGRFERRTMVDGLPSNLVRALFEDFEGALWIGTYGGGMARLEDGRLTAWSTSDGLFNDIAYDILDDGLGNLWMSCNRGVYRVSRRDFADFSAGRLGRLRSVNYRESDGLASQECNGGNPSGWRTADGRLWFVTVRGVVVVDPARLRSARRPPPVLLEQVLVDGRAADLGAPIEIAPGSRSLEFQYAALDLADAARLRFRHRLVGYDQDWSDVGTRRTVYLKGLPQGRYRFEAAATLDGETWSETVSSQPFRVLPRFYETPLFFFFGAAIAVSIGLALQQLRVRRMRSRARELKAEVDAALANVHVLSGLLPICAWCKQVRDDQGYWNQIEAYISSHSHAAFTHGICPDCADKMMRHGTAEGGLD